MHAVVLAGTASSAAAGISFNASSSRADLIHDADRSTSSLAPYVRSLSLVPASVDVPVPPAYQLKKTLTSGASSSQAFGSIGHVTNATTSTFVLAPGTGVIQNDPGDSLFPGASSLKFKVDLLWNVTAGGFGPLATGYGSINVGGVVGDGGSARFLTNISFTDPTTGRKLRPDWVEDTSFRNPGGFSRVFTTSAVLNQDVPALFGTLAAGQQMRISGVVEFRASNAVSPTEIAPLELELGGAPPTGRWNGAVNGTNWTEPANWIDQGQPQNPGLLRVPNASGHRAKFMQSPSPTDVIINEQITVGTLDIDSTNTYRCVLGDEFTSLVFRSPSERAVLNVRQGDHFIDTRVELGSPLDVDVAPGSSMTFTRDVQPTNFLAFTPIRKFGRGTFNLPQSVSADGVEIYDGLTQVEGSASLGTVTVYGGRLAYSPGAFSGGTVDVRAGGTLELNGLPHPADRVTVREHGALSTVDGATMRSLTVGSNLFLSPGAIITPAEFDLPNNIGQTPLYIYGGDLGPDGPPFLVVGTSSGIAFKGIGSAKALQVFGSADRQLQIAGDADLVSTQGGLVEVRSPLVRAGAAAGRITKRGAGTVVLHAVNPFDGPVTVSEGQLLIEGALPGPVTVSPGGTLGGAGTVGAVSVVGTGRLAPGGYTSASAAGPALGPTIATLRTGPLTLGNDSTLAIDLGTPGLADQINVSGDAVIDGVLDLNFTDALAPAEYLILQYQGTGTDQGVRVGVAPDLLAYETRLESVAAGGGRLILRADFPHWRAGVSGSWGDAARWFGGKVPDSAGAVAQFRDAITDGATNSVQLGASRTLGHLQFDSTDPFRLTGPAGAAVTIDNATGGGELVAAAGNHTIAMPIVLADDLFADVAAAARVTAERVGSGTSAVEIVKSGGGTLSVQNAIELAAGSLIDLRAGTLRAGKVKGATVAIGDGASLVIAAEGTSPGATVLDGLVIEGTAGNWRGRFDVGNSAAVVKATAADRDALLAEVIDQVRSARNRGPSGRWSGNGITSSAAAADAMTGVAAVLNDDGSNAPLRPMFEGEPVDANAVLVMYTYNGDANLDGRINADDYFRIDQAFLAQPAAPSYAQGDFNYDGIINADDYFLIDQAFLGQGAPLGVGAALAAVSVPEPGVVTMALICATGAGLRRRRRACTAPVC